MSFAKRTLLQLDRFATPVRLNFRGRDNYATFRGGILAIVVYLITIYCSFGLIFRFLKKEKPTIQFYEKRLDYSKVFRLEENLQTISFVFIDLKTGSSVDLDPWAAKLSAQKISWKDNLPIGGRFEDLGPS